MAVVDVGTVGLQSIGVRDSGISEGCCYTSCSSSPCGKFFILCVPFFHVCFTHQPYLCFYSRGTWFPTHRYRRHGAKLFLKYVRTGRNTCDTRHSRVTTGIVLVATTCPCRDLVRSYGVCALLHACDGSRHSSGGRHTCSGSAPWVGTPPNTYEMFPSLRTGGGDLVNILGFGGGEGRIGATQG